MIVLAIWVLPTFAEFKIQAGDGSGAQLLPVGTTEIEIFVIPGTAESVAGTPCVDGDGDEGYARQIGLEPINGEIVAAPEPAGLAMLAAGSLLIATWGAQRWRRLEAIGE